MTDRELMQMALDALEKNCGKQFGTPAHEALIALRKRLAQPEHVHAIDTFTERVQKTAENEHKWVGLTDAELRDAYVSVCGKEWCIGGIDNAEVFYDAIEAKLKSINQL